MASSPFGYTQICVARGTLLCGSEDEPAGGTNTTFLSARHRELSGRYVKLLMFLLFTSKGALTKSKRS